MSLIKINKPETLHNVEYILQHKQLYFLCLHKINIDCL